MNRTVIDRSLHYRKLAAVAAAPLVVLTLVLTPPAPAVAQPSGLAPAISSISARVPVPASPGCRHHKHKCWGRGGGWSGHR